MAFTVTYSPEHATDDHVVTVKVLLSLEETNALFLSGDTIISWPEGVILESLLPGRDGGAKLDQGSALTRTGMFVSELSRLAHGLKIGYRQSAEAQRSAQLIRLQLLRAGIAEEI
jgi:hypothetical protein